MPSQKKIENTSNLDSDASQDFMNDETCDNSKNLESKFESQDVSQNDSEVEDYVEIDGYTEDSASEIESDYDSEDVERLLTCGRAAEKEKNYDEAAGYYSQAAKIHYGCEHANDLHPELAELWYLYGKSLIKAEYMSDDIIAVPKENDSTEKLETNQLIWNVLECARVSAERRIANRGIEPEKVMDSGCSLMEYLEELTSKNKPLPEMAKTYPQKDFDALQLLFDIRILIGDFATDTFCYDVAMGEYEEAAKLVLDYRLRYSMLMIALLPFSQCLSTTNNELAKLAYRVTIQIIEKVIETENVDQKHREILEETMSDLKMQLEEKPVAMDEVKDQVQDAVEQIVNVTRKRRLEASQNKNDSTADTDNVVDLGEIKSHKQAKTDQ